MTQGTHGELRGLREGLRGPILNLGPVGFQIALSGQECTKCFKLQGGCVPRLFWTNGIILWLGIILSLGITLTMHRAPSAAMQTPRNLGHWQHQKFNASNPQYTLEYRLMGPNSYRITRALYRKITPSCTVP